MRFSVVIPAYRAGATLPAAIESALAQTPTPVEILVVDDASPDPLEALVRVYDGLGVPVRTIRLQTNQGPGSARNAGWEAAKGDFLAFLDADDVWVPNKLARVADALLKTPDAEAFGHDFTVVDPEGPAVIPKGGSGRIDAVGFFASVLKNPFPASALVVRRDVPERFHPLERRDEDHHLIALLARRGRLYRLDLPLTIRRRALTAPGGLSGDRLAMRFGEIRTYARLAWFSKTLLPLLPALVAFSLAKHTREIVRSFLARD